MPYVPHVLDLVEAKIQTRELQELAQACTSTTAVGILVLLDIIIFIIALVTVGLAVVVVDA